MASTSKRLVPCPDVEREGECQRNDCPLCEDQVMQEKLLEKLAESDRQWVEGLITVRERNNYIYDQLFRHSEPVDVRSIVGFELEPVDIDIKE
jgi:hypothetical protein